MRGFCGLLARFLATDLFLGGLSFLWFELFWLYTGLVVGLGAGSLCG